ncbi:hypothetical protein [Nostoc sp. LPT]|uniref:hypothetical protein n=1 Tax=Nostoc sp. LPT TaxID=2815387 RepID=UPI001DDA63E4|nr:hypothetical protein [Nostoc sp. LPT]MBN4003245.1 hypothetical protein [Nostoc sp. LPT]
MASYISSGKQEDCIQQILGTHARYSEINFWITQQNAPNTNNLESQIANLESQVTSLKNEVSNLEYLKYQVYNLEDDVRQVGGIAVFCIGAFCALSAQNTGRNAWLWFFLGIFFAPITVIVLLTKNSADKRSQR